MFAGADVDSDGCQCAGGGAVSGPIGKRVEPREISRGRIGKAAVIAQRQVAVAGLRFELSRQVIAVHIGVVFQDAGGIDFQRDAFASPG